MKNKSILQILDKTFLTKIIFFINIVLLLVYLLLFWQYHTLLIFLLLFLIFVYYWDFKLNLLILGLNKNKMSLKKTISIVRISLGLCLLIFLFLFPIIAHQMKNTVIFLIVFFILAPFIISEMFVIGVLGPDIVSKSEIDGIKPYIYGLIAGIISLLFYMIIFDKNFISFDKINIFIFNISFMLLYFFIAPSFLMEYFNKKRLLISKKISVIFVCIVVCAQILVLKLNFTFIHRLFLTINSSAETKVRMELLLAIIVSLIIILGSIKFVLFLFQDKYNDFDKGKK